MGTITLHEAIDRIFSSNGRIFWVKFRKRTTGELRRMTCRLGVKKYLRGGQLAFDPIKEALVVVFDMDKKAYRMIPLEGIKELSLNKERVKVKIGGERK